MATICTPCFYALTHKQFNLIQHSQEEEKNYTLIYGNMNKNVTWNMNKTSDKVRHVRNFTPRKPQ